MTPEEMTIRRMRQIAFGLLVVALVADAADRAFLSWRLKVHGAERRYVQRTKPRGATPAEFGRALLEATSPKR